MSKNKALFAVLCLACTLALLAAGWALLPQRREPRSAAQAAAEKRAGAFRGTITVWHVSQWRTGGANASSLLSAVLDQVERRNPGVYFTLDTMDTQEAGARMARGESPDILSFPGGMMLPVQEAWQAVAGERLLPCYRDYVAEAPGFYPWMASDARVMIRSSSLDAQKLTAPTGDWTWETLQSLAADLSYETKGKRSQRVYGIASGQGRWPLLAAWGIGEDAIIPGALTEREAWDQLVEGNVSMLLTGPWEEMTLAWRQAEDRGPQVILLDWPRDLPRLRSVQWIGARVSGDGEKDALCREVVERMMSAPVQKKVITQAHCLPVIALSPEEMGDAAAPVETGCVLYALPGREVRIRESWSPLADWGLTQGVYLFKPGGDSVVR